MHNMPVPIRVESPGEAPPIGALQQILVAPWLCLTLMASGLFLLLMMWLAMWGDRGLLAMWQRERDLILFDQQLVALKQENARLSEEIERLNTDLVYIEKIAREELGLVRPGEIVFEFAEERQP